MGSATESIWSANPDKGHTFEELLQENLVRGRTFDDGNASVCIHVKELRRTQYYTGDRYSKQG